MTLKWKSICKIICGASLLFVLLKIGWLSKVCSCRLILGRAFLSWVVGCNMCSITLKVASVWQKLWFVWWGGGGWGTISTISFLIITWLYIIYSTVNSTEHPWMLLTGQDCISAVRPDLLIWCFSDPTVHPPLRKNWEESGKWKIMLFKWYFFFNKLHFYV